MLPDSLFNWVMNEEGVYSDRPLNQDPGGKTKWGITEATLRWHRIIHRRPEIPQIVSMLTKENAREILNDLVWVPLGCDQVPVWAGVLLFDTGVLCGNQQAAKLMQRSVGVKDDGFVGPKTIAAINSSDASDTIDAFILLRQSFLKHLKNSRYNPGWILRTDRLEKLAVAVAEGSEDLSA